MKNIFRAAMAFAFLGISSTGISQETVAWDSQKYPDYVKESNYAVDAAAIRFAQRYEAANQRGLHRAAATGRPDHVNNAATKHFPPVFNQDGGSCGSASRIGYMFTHEMNAYRNLDGSVPENYYPTHFVWLLTYGNSGKDEFITKVGVPNAKTYGGQTYSSTFGSQDTQTDYFGWMTGYDKWYSGFFNRCTSPTSNVSNVGTEVGSEFAKNWLWNHCGDTSFHAGGLIGLGVASGGNWLAIPKTDTNDAIGVTGQYYVGRWGAQVDHAVTMVGYDDRIEFDLDGDGIYGETGTAAKNGTEVGAWIIVNSWGGWCNGGFIYCPYANAGPVSDQTTNKLTGGYWAGEFYHVRKDYRPFRTIKLKMDYSHRSELLLQAGVSADLDATAPESVISFDHFKYAGDGNYGNTDPAPEVPMLGKWADGKLHSEPMEFGYDLTDLSAGYDRNKPLKYFFIITRKKTTNEGSGHIYEASIMDYENDLEGIETPFDLPEGGYEVTTSGNKTMISVVVYGASYNRVNNLAYTDGTISWSAPDKSSHVVKNYNVYKESTLVASINGTSYVPETTETASYSVTAVYEDGKESAKQTVCTPVVLPEKNQVYAFSKAGFSIPEVFDGSYEQATIEFWMKPTTLSNWNNAAGPGWGTWYQHCNSDGTFTVGWNTGNDRVNSSTKLTASTWAHVAIVVNKNKCSLYINGASAGTITSSSYSGIGGFGNYVFSNSTSNNSYQQANYDEIRIWNCARTAAQIKAVYTAATRTQYYGEVMPQGLIAYYKGDCFQGEDGTWYMRDCVGGHHAPVTTTTNRSITPSSVVSFKELTEAGSISVVAPTTEIYAGLPVTFTANRNDYVNQMWWDIPSAGINTCHTENPTVTFLKAGDQKVKVTARDYAGNETSSEITVNVLTAPAIDASFIASKTAVAAGERISFQPTQCVNGYSYVWSMPGAINETVRSVSAAGSYEAFGNYTVTLTVTNANGQSASTSQKITVEEVMPRAEFSVSNAVVMKGSQVLLSDESKFAPKQCQWQLNGTAGGVVINADHAPGSTGFLCEKPGVYDITLVATNDAGRNSCTKERALVVVNADSKNGLNFSPGARVTPTAIPLPKDQTKYSVEWWMNPSKLSDFCLGIGDNDATFQIKTKANGSLVLTNKGKSATSTAGMVVAGQWHHYAITVSSTAVVFYKDGVKVSSGSTTSKFPELTNFSIGTIAADWNGQMDELRIWSRKLEANEILSLGNKPLSADSLSSKYLALYYDFNQTGGNVHDRASQANEGVRSGFGPDGDAWGLSRGVFCLSESSESSQKDVTTTYLSNYKRAFTKSTTLVNSTTANRFYEIKSWQLENTSYSSSTKITTGVHVDAQKSYDFTCTTGWDSFGSLTNHKAFQVCEFEPGIYTLSITFGQHGAAGESYLVATAGETLNDAADLGNALGYANLSAGTMTFVVPQKMQVAIGVLVGSMTGQNIFCIQKFALTQIPLDVREAFVPEGIEETTLTPNDTHTSRGIYNLQGQRVFEPTKGGIYIKDGKKILVK